MIAAGAAVNKVDRRNAVALHEAARGGHLDIVELLLRAGGDPNKTETLSGETVLAVASAHREVIEILLLAGAVPDAGLIAATKDDAVLMMSAVFASPEQLPSGWTRANALQKLSELVAKRTDRWVFELAALGCPLGTLKAALFSGGRIPHPSVFASIDPTMFDVESRDQGGETALHWAAKCSNVQAIEILVRHKKFDVNAREFSKGRTPLFLAETREAATKLIELGADENSVDINGAKFRSAHRRSLSISGLQMSARDGLDWRPLVVTVAIFGPDRVRGFFPSTPPPTPSLIRPLRCLRPDEDKPETHCRRGDHPREHAQPSDSAAG